MENNKVVFVWSEQINKTERCLKFKVASRERKNEWMNDVMVKSEDGSLFRDKKRVTNVVSPFIKRNLKILTPLPSCLSCWRTTGTEGWWDWRRPCRGWRLPHPAPPSSPRPAGRCRLGGLKEKLLSDQDQVMAGEGYIIYLSDILETLQNIFFRKEKRQEMEDVGCEICIISWEK